VRDFDPVRGTLSVNKARVKGIDRNCTKTRQDRLIELCPRARAVLTRHLYSVRSSAAADSSITKISSSRETGRRSGRCIMQRIGGAPV
jgi:hypothetical protein